ncbi:MAG: MarR family transcriptional regulator [Oscillospiraceae bacterium]|nr:MarR family transcriptional regulator [Oscillospiraceae bacterium]
MRPAFDETLSGRLIGSFFRFLHTPWHMVPAPGLSRMETGVLLTVHHAEVHGKVCRVSTLSRKMHIASPTVTQHIANLERRGLVSKTPDERDKRAANLALTPLGMQMLEQHRARMDQNIDELVACLTPEEAEHLVALMNKTCDFFDAKKKAEDDW